MRFAFILICFLYPIASVAASPKEFKELMETSRKTRSELSKEKSFEKKSQKFKELEKDINTALSEHQKANPTEGDDKEEKVAKLLYSLEPVGKLAAGKKPSIKDCEKAQHQIDVEDRGSREEAAPLSVEATEAQNWVKVFCHST